MSFGRRDATCKSCTWRSCALHGVPPAVLLRLDRREETRVILSSKEEAYDPNMDSSRTRGRSTVIRRIPASEIHRCESERKVQEALTSLKEQLQRDLLHARSIRQTDPGRQQLPDDHSSRSRKDVGFLDKSGERYRISVNGFGRGIST